MSPKADKDQKRREIEIETDKGKGKRGEKEREREEKREKGDRYVIYVISLRGNAIHISSLYLEKFPKDIWGAAVLPHWTW